MITNIVNSICMATMDLYNTSFYRFIKKRKINKYIKELEDTLKEENIFDVSEYLLNILISMSDEFKEEHGLTITGPYMSFKLNDSTTIEYNPIFNRFGVTYWDNYFKFEVSKNINPPKYLKIRWESTIDEIFSLYIDIIKDIAFELLG